MPFLLYFSGDLFLKLLDKYLRVAFQKGVPPLFITLKSLYSDPKKVFIARPQGYKTYMLNSTAHEIYHAHKC